LTVKILEYKLYDQNHMYQLFTWRHNTYLNIEVTYHKMYMSEPGYSCIKTYYCSDLLSELR
jgi:hypothetical protein